MAMFGSKHVVYMIRFHILELWLVKIEVGYLAEQVAPKGSQVDLLVLL